MPSILEAGKAEVAKVVAVTPNSFTIGAHTDGKGVVAQATYNRTWTNGWGAVAYAKAWYHDTAVTPNYEAGVQVTKKF